MTSSCFEVNGWNIWYDKYGTGPKPMLLLSGALGTAKTDFYEQLEGDDAFDQNEFTIIGVEAPGWGRSRPPARPYGTNLYDNDVECFVKLMQHLGYEKFYVVGWSDGAIVSMWMACKYPQMIERMVFSGVLTTLYPRTVAVLQSTRNVEGWGKDKLECYLRAYESKEVIQQLWSRHLKFVDYFSSYFPKDSNLAKYTSIKFPLLIIHGDRDPISTWEHPEYILKHVKHAKHHRFPTGHHDLHQRYTGAYKKLVEDFLLK